MSCAFLTVRAPRSGGLGFEMNDLAKKTSTSVGEKRQSYTQ